MSNYKYREIKKTESQINDRLLNFIIEKDEIEGITSDLDINKPPLDNWISSDYIRINGNTYIDEFLELYFHTLEPLEIEILNQKLISHISMFEIIQIKGDKIYIEDKLDSKFYTVIDDNIGSVLLEGDNILARVGKIRGEYIFIGDVEYIPSSIKNLFVENILIYFNRERLDKPNLELKNYLKRYSLDIYSMYKECLVYHMENTEDEIPPIISDIAEFQEYAVDNFPKDYHMYMTNLMEIFEYGLMDKDLSLQNIDKINLYTFFKDAINDGFINSKEDYNLYLETLKAYLTFLGPGNPKYRESYNQVVEISNNRFRYMRELRNTNFNYKYDRMLVSTISNRLNTHAITFVGDLDRFLIFVMEFEIQLTDKRKEIQKKDLLSLNKLLKLSYPFHSSRPNQRDSKIIELFYHLTLDSNLTAIDDKRMVITEKGKNFFKLRDEEKFAFALSYIWNKDFIMGLSSSRIPVKIEDEVVDRFLEFQYHSLDDLLNDISDSRTRKALLSTGFIRYLILVGVAEFDKNYDIHFTSLGNIIYRYLLSIKDQKTKVINLENFKENKTKEV